MSLPWDVENPPPIRPSIDIIQDPREMLERVKPEDQPEARALVRWVHMCSEEATKHEVQARSLRGMHWTMSIVSILLNASATVVAAVGPQFAPCTGTAGFITAGLTSGSVIASSVHAVLDPAGRRQAHMNAETQYSSLGRDIAVRLTTMTSDGHLNTSWSVVLLQYQRRLDNIRSVAPPL